MRNSNHRENDLFILLLHEVVHVYVIFDKHIQQNMVFEGIYLNLVQHLTRRLIQI